MSSVPERSEVAEVDTWNLEAIFASEAEWREAVADVRSQLESIRTAEGSVTTDAETLRSVLEERDELLKRTETVAAYARMRRDEDTRDQDAQALHSEGSALVAEVRSAVSFIEPEIQSLEWADLAEMIETEPGLERYDHHLNDVMRRKRHTRSAEVEAVLADLSEVTGSPGEIYTMLANADLTFPTVEEPSGESVQITQSNLTRLLKRPERSFRQSVYESYFDEWENIRNTVATAYRNSVKADVRLARTREYESARAAALDGPNVPVSVYDTLVETVRDGLDPLHRHLELKREALGVEELRPWDLYMPVTETESPEVPYEDAREHVVASLEPLGADYQQQVSEGLDSRWVDVYETAGKRSGAYSGGTYETDPYILMNYQDTVSSMFTLAHELGHSMHSELTAENQPYVYADYEIFVAEVASMVHEGLLTAHLLENGDPELVPHVLSESLERVRSTLYRQTLFAEFEHRVHTLEEDGEPLTADRLDELYRSLKAAYYEPTALDDRIDREWMRIPHFYRAFYVYQYATGISAAMAIVERIRSEGASAAADYRTFLSRGSRGYPLELLSLTGIDIESGAAFERALERYGERVNEFERIDRND